VHAALVTLQMLVAGTIAAVVAERLWALVWLAPLSAPLADAVARALHCASRSALQEIVLSRPRSHAAQLIQAQAEDLDEALHALRAEAGQRLGLLRVLATLSSTLGLLTGIWALMDGFDPSRAGLDALESGLPERLAMSRALAAMATGVGCSGVCFYALGRFRTLAQALWRDDQRLAARLRPS
jgi:biopolymer transport protein ExbB/TolQ